MKQWVGLVKLCAGVDGINETVCRSGWDCSNFLQKCKRLVKFLHEQTQLVKSAFGSRWDWSNFIREQTGLVNLSEGVNRIGQTLRLSRCDWSRGSVGVRGIS